MLTEIERKGWRLTFALAFLQLVQALGVTELGTFRFLPAEVPGLDWLDEHCWSVPVGFVEDDGSVGDEGWTSCTEWPEELSVAEVSDLSVRIAGGG